jgi:hypothetical protein
MLIAIFLSVISPHKRGRIMADFHPLTVSVPRRVAQHVLNVGRTKIYDLLGLGQLEAVKNGARTEITVESIRRYQANLPRATFKPPHPPRLDNLDKLHAKQRAERGKRRAARHRKAIG